MFATEQAATQENSGQHFQTFHPQSYPQEERGKLWVTYAHRLKSDLIVKSDSEWSLLSLN